MSWLYDQEVDKQLTNGPIKYAKNGLRRGFRAPPSPGEGKSSSSIRQSRALDKTYEADLYKRPRSMRKSHSAVRVISSNSGLTQDLIIKEPLESTYFRGFTKPPSKRVKKVLWIETRSDYQSSDSEFEEFSDSLSRSKSKFSRNSRRFKNSNYGPQTPKLSTRRADVTDTDLILEAELQNQLAKLDNQIAIESFNPISDQTSTFHNNDRSTLRSRQQPLSSIRDREINTDMYTPRHRKHQDGHLTEALFLTGSEKKIIRKMLSRANNEAATGNIRSAIRKSYTPVEDKSENSSRIEDYSYHKAKPLHKSSKMAK